MAMMLTGLIGHSAPGLAQRLDPIGLTTPRLALSASNIPTLPSVPEDQTIVTSDTIANAEPITYDSLSDAVASVDNTDSDDENLRCLAGAIYFESKGEPLSGQLAVAEVIINRAQSGRFPSDICSVVKQPGQFSFVRGGEMPTVSTARSAYRTAIAVAKVAIDDMWDSPAAKALFFHARRVSPGWHRTQIASIGNHVFYR